MTTRRIFGIRLLTIVLLSSGGVTAEGPHLKASEDQVKAAFLYNFAKFVEWPSTPDQRQGPMAMCVWGEDPFAAALERVIEGKKVNGRQIAVRRTEDVAEARSCHVLFVGSAQAGRVAEVLKAVRLSSVLTVSDVGGFCERGGVIAFVMEGQRIRFQINPQAAARARLLISSKLFELAVATPVDKENR